MSFNSTITALGDNGSSLGYSNIAGPTAGPTPTTTRAPDSRAPDNRPKTIICDIDGTLFKHNIPSFNTDLNSPLQLLPGTLEKFAEWDKKGYYIILITGRRESMRKATEFQLAKYHLFYDQLIMGCGGGSRVLINDDKPNGAKAAFVINLERNKGIKDIEI